MGQKSITLLYGMHGYSNIKYLRANPMLAPLLVHLGEYPGPGGRVLNKFLYGEAPSRGPTPCPFIYHFS